MDDIKSLKRQKKQVTAADVMFTEDSGEEKKEEIKFERKRVSFDLRTDLHKELKMQSVERNEKIYLMIEEALERYLEGTKK